MKKTILIGPLPPPLGGATILFQQLVDDLSLRSDLDLKVINTYCLKKDSDSQNINIFKRFFHVSYELFRNIKEYDSVGCHVSKRGFSVFAPLVLFIGRLFNKKVIIRKFGGELKHTYESSNIIYKKVIKYVMTADEVLLETIEQVDFFSKESPSSRILWYPNSRPGSQKKIVDKKFNKRIIFLGHVKKSKGILDLVEAVKGLDISLDIYGPLIGVAESQLKFNNITYKGILDSSLVAKTISKYSLLVLPTYYEGEGYPGVIIESYSVGVPVVSTNWRSIPEIVEHGVTGMLVDIKNPAGLKSILIKIEKDEGLYLKLCIGACNKFTDFDSKKLTDKYFSII
ncbi:glycosyltransferase [Shewanella sp. HL-SH4]|uniref:glycosyltransferase n=1 Tax=Shewanella sp. HL-SH4 TaxID=3436240 RepID=UPI003EB696D1